MLPRRCALKEGMHWPFSRMSDAKSMPKVIEKAVGSFRTIDILVNNAAIAVQGPFDEITEEQWNKVHAINQRGLFLCAQAAGKLFKEQKSGKIVNISSFSGKQAVAEYTIYSATKAAVIMITQTLAIELGPYNVKPSAPASCERRFGTPWSLRCGIATRPGFLLIPDRPSKISEKLWPFSFPSVRETSPARF